MIQRNSFSRWERYLYSRVNKWLAANLRVPNSINRHSTRPAFHPCFTNQYRIRVLRNGSTLIDLRRLPGLYTVAPRLCVRAYRRFGFNRNYDRLRRLSQVAFYLARNSRFNLSQLRISVFSSSCVVIPTQLKARRAWSAIRCRAVCIAGFQPCQICAFIAVVQRKVSNKAPNHCDTVIAVDHYPTRTSWWFELDKYTSPA